MDITILRQGKDKTLWFEKPIFFFQALAEFLTNKRTRWDWEKSRKEAQDRWSIVLGTRVWVSSSLDNEELAMTLSHELTHVKQISRLKGPYWLKLLQFYFAYLFLPLPILYTYRAKWEFEAYLAQASVMHILGYSPRRIAAYAQHVEKIFKTSYFWMDGLGWGTKGFNLDFNLLIDPGQPLNYVDPEVLAKTTEFLKNDPIE